ncbi:MULTISPECIES: L-seryl-tRNA(Sec) selenium transferase [Dermacoccus]|uniref:L-seryl-tRNA(Sec) selenium transferase n=1 Tax=Dermacoccus TaxID=57495 RepID=UPI00119E5C9A|nr:MULTISPECIES: L-seryl-tRNA(Sec) selenium transferase [Dermacoccus]MBO1758536.1 L-seryl-tRNA(Sec) selenium transferase [Dermacoccus sp. NHGro5]MCG7428665.1 L-seryl-tRNA(Sec) selenium transferase [Dermacoccus nishinomiyaensis]MCI0153856.1 L-seryl-tRNA(Sec) selenium transferase [Dermacoccus nishinomiyaensis]NHC31055.1 L-seryl-tRNA(Sec) selenium transferase [Dermacoccus nishinomiyaensis]
MATSDDPRRRIPRTDELLARFADEVGALGRDAVKRAIVSAQADVRAGTISPDGIDVAIALRLPESATTLRAILNATGVVVHTNIGRAPLSDAAVEALGRAAGYVDVEFDPVTATRAKRGRATLDALQERVPDAGGALVVNNGAAALLLACLAIAGDTDVLVSRGELIEIGDGFRLPELLQSAGARLVEVGMTNRTHLRDYENAIVDAERHGRRVGAVLKIHTSNYRVEGFAGVPGVRDLAALGVPVIADVGSGLLAPERVLPDEPDATSWLRDGATVVTASGDKLLGGPQAGLVLGDADAVERVRRHPMARAMRVDKLTLAALEATLRGPEPPVTRALHETRDSLRQRTTHLAAAIADVVPGAEVVDVIGRVGGGGAPGFELPSLAVALPEPFAEALRLGRPCVLARTALGRCLVDLRCVPASSDADVAAAIRAVAVGNEPGTPADDGGRA